ncbi:hypothetical protein [Pseudorhizobium pelagicum]|uniref:Uncharacterized protein n=1 Tax=Pseudorhizobium pelagicum TaxID=1509405 RepID=A0A922P1Z6_9HYPH|nr:hypothetical protein [Pseudorhizobium pelagicum]KEQ03274.1 hypothetical protein GV67_14235 [Pseudorhizobium pelagicum]KEQ05157.1 hypothetical protein GV68_11480 [Pseudorhizobium pelagicum]
MQHVARADSLKLPTDQSLVLSELRSSGQSLSAYTILDRSRDEDLKARSRSTGRWKSCWRQGACSSNQSRCDGRTASYLTGT